MRVHRERRIKMVRRMTVVVVTGVVLAAAGVAAYAYSRLSSADKILKGNEAVTPELLEVLDERKPQEPFTVLLLGNDHRAGEEAARADTIIVARIDTEKKQVWMLSIPRDTRVEIPGYGVQKINAANFHGGPPLVVETVQNFLGIPINHYMEIDFNGFLEMVDSLGGVWIDVDVEIDDKKAASHGSRQAYHIDPGYQLLDGEHALTYVRSRDFVDADFTRMKHQQAFFKALADQATQIDNVLKIPGMVENVAKYIITDMSVKQLAEVALALRDAGGKNVQTATVTGEWRSPYVWTDEERKTYLVNAMMDGRSFDGTTTPTADFDPATVSVTVRNGAGIEGCAAAAADILRGKGYDVKDVGNAGQFVYEETLVVYKTDKPAAEHVADELPTARIIASSNMYDFTTDILVVVGKDYSSWQPAQATTQ